MTNRNKKITQAIVTAAVGLGVVLATTPIDAKSNCPVEKCYGIAKKKKNDCGTPKHACAAQSVQNGDPTEWMYVMKGSCKSIVGGHLKPHPASAMPVASVAANQTKK